MCLKAIYNFFTQPRSKEAEIPPIIYKVEPAPTQAPDSRPLIRVPVGWEYVYNIINAAFPAAPHIYLSDNSYELCSKADYQWFLANDPTDKFTYIVEKFDCDDFTYRLTGQLSVPGWSAIADGTIWTEAHAFKFFIDEAGKLWFVEPQTDAIFDTWQPYFGSEIQFIGM